MSWWEMMGLAALVVFIAVIVANALVWVFERIFGWTEDE